MLKCEKSFFSFFFWIIEVNANFHLQLQYFRQQDGKKVSRCDPIERTKSNRNDVIKFAGQNKKKAKNCLVLPANQPDTGTYSSLLGIDSTRFCTIPAAPPVS